MNIGMVQNITPLGVGSVFRARTGMSKVPVPVRRNEYIYARFKHIFGFPSLNRGEGYSVTKLRALDNLIERMEGLGKETAGPVDIGAASETRIEELIGDYQGEIHQAIQNLTASPALNAQFSGLTVDLSI